MAGKWIKLALAASIAINVAFVASTIIHHPKKNITHQETPPPTVGLDKIDFQLRDEQKKEIQHIIKKFKLNMLSYKQDILDKRIAIIETLSDAEFNPTEIDNKTAELNQLENQLNLIFVDALVQVNNILDSQQRLNFLLYLSRNWFFMAGAPPTTAPAGGHHD